MMYKSVRAVLALSMLISACATESKLAVNSESAEATPADLNRTMQPAASQAVAAETKPVEVKAVAKPATELTVSRLAAAPDFNHCLVNWSDAMQASLTPWTGAIKQCDTRGSGKQFN